VDNTSDLNKPISTATQGALDALEQELASDIAPMQQDISNLQTAMPGKEDKANKGVASGYTPLDDNTKVPLAYLPDSITGQMVHAGEFVPSTAIATLTDAAKDILGTTDDTITLTNDTTPITGYKANQGNYYLASVNGDFASISFEVGDWLVANSTGWAKIDNTDAVTGVKGSAETNYRVGNVNITADNIGIEEGAQVNKLEEINVNGVPLVISNKTVNIAMPTGALASKNNINTADIVDKAVTLAKLDDATQEKIVKIDSLMPISSIDTALTSSSVNTHTLGSASHYTIVESLCWQTL
jgi:hypothetical protein